MNKSEVKKKWVEALKSGGYNQGFQQLKSSKGFCCLGVLCDLYRNETGEGEWVLEENNEYMFHSKGEMKHYLPNEVAKWAGLEGPDPKVGIRFLTELNDKRYSFKSIADHIERFL